MTEKQANSRKIFLVAGEESGDQLGGRLMRAITAQASEPLSFEGVGGHTMIDAGLKCLFPLEDIAVMGFTAVVGRLRTLINRINRTVEAAIAANPDVLVIIDSPDFTHRVAKKVRLRAPHIPIVDYVSPSVWAWRPGRAKKMRAYVDRLFAILPFEPDVHKRLGGPPCTYVGHPLIERVDEFRPKEGERSALGVGRIKLLVLPGSRHSEVSRLMQPFGDAIGHLAERYPNLDIVIPAVAHRAAEIEERAKTWKVKPEIVVGEQAKLEAFRSAHAALAASGTVTLELALSGVPMVVGYKMSKLEYQLRHFVNVPSIVLANLVLQHNAVPELLQWDCTPEKIVRHLAPLLEEGAERWEQIAAFKKLDALMEIGGDHPSERAARIVLETLPKRV